MPTADAPLFCPSCGKENPAGYKVCRFCAASIERRISLKIVPVGVVLLLAIAAAHFHWAANYVPDYAPIPSLTAERNFERVRVRGRVADVQILREAYDHHQVRIELEGEGERSPDNRISVRLEGEPANDFLANPGLLNRGDLVDVAAALYAGAGYRHLSVSSAQFIRVLEKGSGPVVGAGEAETRAPAAPAVRATVADLLADPEKYRDQVIVARPLEVVETPAALPFFRVADVGRPEPQLVVIGFKGAVPAVGARISVRGKFTFYEKKGYWELQVRDWDQGAVIVLPDGASE